MNTTDYNKYCIITPTFSGHFCFIKDYIKSFNKYVEDKDNCIIYFVISRNENTEFQKIISDYKNLNIEILFLEDVLAYFSIEETPNQILNRYKKFSFQAIKKFYTMLYLKDYKRFLVLDSETMWIRKTNIKNLFDMFFEKPMIFYSDSTKREALSEPNKRILDIADLVFKEKLDLWFIEQFMRFWDIDILSDFIKEYGSIYDIVKQIDEYENQKPFRNIKFGFFESVLYDRFIYKNNEKYKYNIIDMDAEYNKYLNKKDYDSYIESYEKIYHGCCGIYEHFSQVLNKKNALEIAKFYNDKNITIVRIDEAKNNYKSQKKFLEAVKPYILTCSSSHFFGLNAKKYLLGKLKITKNISRLKDNFIRLLTPFKYLIKWLNDLILFIYNIFKFFIDIIIGIIK